MDQPILASRQGGPIAVDEGSVKKMQPVAVSISIAAQGQSLAGRFLGWLVQIVRPEASLSG